MSFHDDVQAAWATVAPRYQQEPPLHVERDLVVRALDGKKHVIRPDDQDALLQAIMKVRPIWIRAKTHSEGRFQELALRYPTPERAVLCLSILREELGIRGPDARLIRQGNVYWVLAAGALSSITRGQAERVLDLLDGRGFRSDFPGFRAARFEAARQQAIEDLTGLSPPELAAAVGDEAATLLEADPEALRDHPCVKEHAASAAHAVVFPSPHRATTLDAAWYPLPGSWNLLDGNRVEGIDLRRHA